MAQLMLLRVYRAVALLILLWAVVDMSVPSLCQTDRDFQFPPFQQQTTGVVGVDRGQPPATPDPEDDCFCCCPHISPAPHFELARFSSSEHWEAVQSQLRLLDLPQLLYHPPRS